MRNERVLPAQDYGMVPVEGAKVHNERVESCDLLDNAASEEHMKSDKNMNLRRSPEVGEVKITCSENIILETTEM